MTESEGKTYTITHEPKPAAGEVKIIALPLPQGTLQLEAEAPAALPAPLRQKRQNPEQIRMKKIRGLLAALSVCPDPETYCQRMDQARMTLPEVCRNLTSGPRTYAEAYRTPRFATAIRAEKARAWKKIRP